MRQFILAAVALILWSAAACKESAKVSISNNLGFDRKHESVELQWSVLQKKIEGLTPENVVVIDKYNRQTPSQVIYQGGDNPLALLFQVSVSAKSTAEVTVAKGVREDYKPLVFGRYVPERKDDYTWENNLAAYRVYGQQLKVELITPGTDVWCKRTDDLVIDKRYKLPNYHIDNGDGMDCYKVGLTLGGGACVPYIDGKIILGDNYSKWTRLDNGPLRTSVRLEYSQFDAGGKKVAYSRTITLDANTHFNRVDNIFNGAFKSMDVVSGIVRHDVINDDNSQKSIALAEKASDSQTPGNDGTIYLGVVTPSSKEYISQDDHSLLKSTVKSGEKLTYYVGSGWSKWKVNSFEEWRETVSRQLKIAQSPLKISIK